MTESGETENAATVSSGESDGGADQRIGMNKVVHFHYRLAEVDREGERSDWLEQSHGGEPLAYLHGFHNVVVGLEKALEGKQVGDKIEITLQPEEAYGHRNPDAVRRVSLKNVKLPNGAKTAKAGMLAMVQTAKGLRNVVILKAGKFSADVDFNHPLCGRTLYYEVEVASIRDADKEEIEHGHAHGPGGHHQR